MLITKNSRESISNWYSKWVKYASQAKSLKQNLKQAS